MKVWDAHKHLSQGMQSGEVQPLPWTVYSRDHAQEAFRFLAGGGCRPEIPPIHPTYLPSFVGIMFARVDLGQWTSDKPRRPLPLLLALLAWYA